MRSTGERAVSVGVGLASILAAACVAATRGSLAPVDRVPGGASVAGYSPVRAPGSESSLAPAPEPLPARGISRSLGFDGFGSRPLAPERPALLLPAAFLPPCSPIAATVDPQEGPHEPVGAQDSAPILPRPQQPRLSLRFHSAGELQERDTLGHWNDLHGEGALEELIHLSWAYRSSESLFWVGTLGTPRVVDRTLDDALLESDVILATFGVQWSF